MMSRVLVLNQDYTPLTICSVRRAFLLVYLSKAELLSEIVDLKLRTVTKTFPYPSVIRVHQYVSLPYRGVVMSRHNIFKRDGFVCQYCGTKGELTLDHVIPRSKGGKSSWSNLVTACKPCNARKGNYSPQEAGLTLLRAPSKPSYLLFLQKSMAPINEDWLQYLGQKKVSA